MSDNIISFREAKAKRMKPECSYFVRIDHYEDGIGGEVLLEDLSPEELRSVSDNLFAMARHVRDMVWERTRNDDDQHVSVTRIYGSGRVTCWTSNDIATDEHVAWLRRRFDEAAEASAPE